MIWQLKASIISFFITWFSRIIFKSAQKDINKNGFYDKVAMIMIRNVFGRIYALSSLSSIIFFVWYIVKA